MKIVGNILDIKNKRDSKHKDIELEIEKIVYITHKKDGRYFQPFEFVETLESPIKITGDLLARVENKNSEERKYEFRVYDKEDDVYELNPNKNLIVNLEYDVDTAETILTNVNYSVTVGLAEFNELKSMKAKEKGLQKENIKFKR